MKVEQLRQLYDEAFGPGDGRYARTPSPPLNWREVGALLDIAEACPSPATLRNVAGLMVEEGAIIVAEMLVDLAEARSRLDTEGE